MENKPYHPFEPTGHETDQEVVDAWQKDLECCFLEPHEVMFAQRLIDIARDGLLHRALSKGAGGEPVAVRWMRWAQRVLPVLKEHLEGFKYRDIELSHLIEEAPKETE